MTGDPLSKTGRCNKKIYTDISPSFFSESPDSYDRSYISGVTREKAVFTDEYTRKKAAALHDMKRVYSGCPAHFLPVSRNDANTPELSWLTVISGKRPMGQFSVDSLYSPELHALLEFPDIGCKIFPMGNNNFLHIVVVYRKDCEQGERYADRFIELYDKKRQLMNNSTDEPCKQKFIKSKLAVAREMGEVFNYLPEEIDDYMDKLNSSVKQFT